MNGKTCGSCKFWLENPVNPQNLGAPRMGTCCRHPPQLLTIQQPQGVQIIAAQPTVEPRFPACGEHAEQADSSQILTMG